MCCFFKTRTNYKIVTIPSVVIALFDKNIKQPKCNASTKISINYITNNNSY